jgi:predicted ester cyclase
MRALRVLGAIVGVGLVAFAAMAGIARASTEASTPMTAAQTKQTMDGYLKALVGGGSYETYFADDVVVTVVGAGLEVKGPAAAKQMIDGMHHQQFDATLELKGLVVGEGAAALEAVFVGTHIGEFAGIAPTGKKVTVPYGVFYELKDGKITALRIYALAEGLVQQLQ